MQVMTGYLTSEGLEKLKKELDYLKNVKAKEIAQRLNQAAGFGDLSENAAYHQAKEDLAFLRGRVAELEKIIINAKVAEKNSGGDLVQIGSTVTIASEQEKETLQIVGPDEAKPTEGKISYQSPLGQALFGCSQGAEVEITAPKGKIKYKILKIE